MDESELKQSVREHIDELTLSAGLSQLDAVRISANVLEDLRTEYEMTAEELEAEELEGE